MGMSAMGMTALSEAEAAARRDLYRLAARLFSAEVDLALYRRLVGADLAAKLDPIGLSMVEPGIRALGEEKAVEELAVEFCRLFVGPDPACLPYASVHAGEALLGGRAARRLEEFMAREGLTPLLPEGFPVVSPDHLGVELALLARLHDIVARSYNGSDNDGDRGMARERAWLARGELVRDHLLPWAPEYLQTLRAHARIAPYTAVGPLVAALLRDEPT